MDDQDKAKPRRRAFGDITNTLQSETPKEVPAKKKLTEEQLEARRRRDRANYAKKNPIAKRKRKDSQPSQVCNKDNLESNASVDWLHRNDHYTVSRFSERVDMSVTVNPKMPLIGSGDGSIIDLTEPNQKDSGEIMDDKSGTICGDTNCMIESSAPPESTANIVSSNLGSILTLAHQTCLETQGTPAIHVADCSPGEGNNDQIDSTRARARAHYKNLTEAQRNTRRQKQNSSEARLKKNARRKAKRDVVCPESIAMENPDWVPEPVFPARQKASLEEALKDDSILLPTWRPLHLPTQSEPEPVADMCDDPEMPNLSRHRNVGSGERRALRTRRNQQFHDRCHAQPSIIKEDEQEDFDTHVRECITQLNQDPKEDVVEEEIGGHDEERYEYDSNGEEDDIWAYQGEEEEIADHSINNDHLDADKSPISVEPDPYDYVYSNLPEAEHVLPEVEDCGNCGAKRFHKEAKGFCCRSGQVKLKHHDTAPELMRLWTSSDADARHFRDHIRWFNGHFSFTSLYCSLDDETTNMKRGNGIYTFRAHGQMYHNIRGFGKESGLEPSHLELYFYDDDPALQHRYRCCREQQKQKDEEVIAVLVDILKGNPYSEKLRTMGQVENVDEYRIGLNLDVQKDQRTYNLPLASEVAAVWVEGRDRVGHVDRGVVLHGHNREITGIRSYNASYDPLSYPLFFPRGEPGWHTDIPKQGFSYADVLKESARKKALGARDTSEGSGGGRMSISIRDYYCYRFQMRRGIFNPLLYGKRLFQQFAVDTYIKIETSRLEYIRNHQTELRADLYQGLWDSLNAGEEKGAASGKRTVLCKSFIGGPRDRRKRYMDAMALVRKYGKPDIFLTMTCNPNWKEIRENLYPGQEAQDRLDLVVRVFRAKLEEMKDKLFKKHILGRVKARVYVVEFQKRGLPHAHFLLIMEQRYKLTCPEQYDRLICAELPDKKKYPLLYRTVTKWMMHGPCGRFNLDCPCTRGRDSCKNRYPRPFNQATMQGKDSYPVYRRREDGRSELVRKHVLDNRWVVPYNPYLLQYFNCHINVEAVASIKAVKYLFKYIYKGHDRATITVGEANNTDDNAKVDEIKQYRDARWVTPPEALWRIYGFDMSENYPPVQQLQLHLPGMHMVAYHQNQNIGRVLQRPDADKSMLTEYFEKNKTDKDARGILYRDFPEHYTWNTKDGKFWKKREREHVFQVGRIVQAHPGEGERYYLRVLLNHVPGATSFSDLRTVKNVEYPTFREAAEKLGLMEGDNAWDDALTEATTYAMPQSLRRLFATILVFGEPSHVANLWSKHLYAMGDDYRRDNPCKKAVEQLVLMDIRDMLQSMGKDIRTFPLPMIDGTRDAAAGIPREIYEERVIEVNEADEKLCESLNTEQTKAYEAIMRAVDSPDGGVFFVDGPGGTGKTFLYRALLGKLRAQGRIAVATATSGVAASIMPGGRTAHSRFKIPLNIEEDGYCSFTKQSGTAKLLREAALVIWDEASMTKRQAVEALDNSMRDIMDRSDLPFGGKTFVFGGDFRQTLPVVRKGSRAQIVDSSLRRSYIWDHMHHLKLALNMRAQNDPWFSEYLLRIGGGTEEVNSEGEVELQQGLCIPYTGQDDDLDALIDFVFPALEANKRDSNYITSRAILSTKNDCVDKINMKMISKFNGEERVYHSFDSAVDDPHNYYPSEFLNTLTPNGLPPHVLKLKRNCPVILLRNLDPANGLCNGTRLVVRDFQKNVIDAEIVLGQHAGKRVFLPRIPLCPYDDEMFPFQFKRKQFPIRLSFAMTINKAQGQTIPTVGIFLPEPVFSHGQLYVALSRATARKNVKVLAYPTDHYTKQKGEDNNAGKGKKRTRKNCVKKIEAKLTGPTLTKNIVYKEILTS